MNTEQELRDKITEQEKDVKKYRKLNNDKNLELIQLRDYKKEVERIAKNDPLWNEKVNVDTLKSLITKQDLIIREYKHDIDTAKKCIDIARKYSTCNDCETVNNGSVEDVMHD
jgi:hypothetical protein